MLKAPFWQDLPNYTLSNSPAKFIALTLSFTFLLKYFVCLSMTNPNYLRTGITEWSKKIQRHLWQKLLSPKILVFQKVAGRARAWSYQQKISDPNFFWRNLKILEASSYDQINMTKFWLEHDQNFLQQWSNRQSINKKSTKPLTIEHDWKIY